MSPDPVQAGKFSRQFRINFSGGGSISVAEIWPDGDAPDNPTAADVAKVVRAAGLTDLLFGWGFDDTIDVAVLQAERDAANEKFLDLAEMAGVLKRQRDELVGSAQAFLDTMPLRHSDVYGREVPSGFTADSSNAARALFDTLARLTGERP